MGAHDSEPMLLQSADCGRLDTCRSGHSSSRSRRLSRCVRIRSSSLESGIRRPVLLHPIRDELAVLGMDGVARAGGQLRLAVQWLTAGFHRTRAFDQHTTSQPRVVDDSLGFEAARPIETALRAPTDADGSQNSFREVKNVW